METQLRELFPERRIRPLMRAAEEINGFRGAHATWKSRPASGSEKRGQAEMAASAEKQGMPSPSLSLNETSDISTWSTTWTPCSHIFPGSAMTQMRNAGGFQHTEK